MSDKRKQAPPCPQCGSHRTVPIVYGFVPASVGEAAERGEVVLGGCMLTGEDPEWACLACGHRWGRVRLGGGR